MVVCLRQANQRVSQYRKRPKVTTRYLPNLQPLGLVTFGNTYFRGVVTFGGQKTLDKLVRMGAVFEVKDGSS